MAKKKKPNGYWNKERCAESARPYATRKEWKNAEGSAYNAARKKGWLDECCAHMGLPGGGSFSHKEYVDEVAAIRPDYRVIGEYVGARTKITHECGEGHQWDALPFKIKAGKGCPHCSGRIPQDYTEWLAENSPDIKVIGEYVNARTKTTHQCSEGHRWDVTPDSIKRGHGCPQCMDKSSDANVVYCWEVTKAGDDVPQPMPGYRLVKFGITTKGCKNDRIRIAANRNKMQHEVRFYQHTGDYEARKHEKWLHSFGQCVAMPDRIDGKTEFRLISDAELQSIKEMLPVLVRMTPEQLRPTG